MCQRPQCPSQEAHDGSLLPDLVRLQCVELNNNPVNQNKAVNPKPSASIQI